MDIDLGVTASVEITELMAPTVPTTGGAPRGVSLSASYLDKTVYIATSGAITIVIDLMRVGT